MSEVQLHQHGSAPSSFENVPVGPFATLEQTNSFVSTTLSRMYTCPHVYLYVQR